MLAINHASTHVTQQPLLVQSLCKGMHSQQHLHYAQLIMLSTHVTLLVQFLREGKQ